MENKDYVSLVIRLVILIVLGIGIKFLYYILTPVTVYPVFLVFKQLYGATLVSGNEIIFKGYHAFIVEACVAAAAYYFLIILNLTTPMNLKKRLASLTFLIVVFYILNVARIMVFGVLFTKGYQYFDFAHLSMWYFGSTVLVLLIWMANVIIFNIKEIPIYTELRNIFRDIN